MSVKSEQVVLAYSGGLDTSYCVVYLKESGFDVHAVLINTGGFDLNEIKLLEKRAFDLGASSFKSINNENDYYDRCLRYLIFGNVLRNNTYPLSVSSERAFQAMAILQYAIDNGAGAVAHGSTGAGNDQIRFDSVFSTKSDNIRVITPIRDLSLSRQEEIDFLRGHGFEWKEERKNYSINQGLWGTSIGGVETLESRHDLPEDAWPHQCIEKGQKEITISFQNGEPIAIDGKTYDHPVQLIKSLNEIGNAYAIGRDIHVGDTIIGIKGRVAFSAPAAIMLIKAHELLEKHTLTKWQSHWKRQLSDWYGMFLHEGKYSDPVMRNIESFLSDTQTTVNGDVFLRLHPYRFDLIGISSVNDLMTSDFGKYGEDNKGWTGDDVKGFTKIYSNAEKIYYHVNNKKDTP